MEKTLEKIKENYEGSDLEIVLPDEMSRRLGQSFTAAGL